MVTEQMFSDTVNWAKGVNERGQPVRDPAKDHHVAGALVSSANGGATNWPPPSFSPDTGLFYVPTAETYAMYYLSETDPTRAMGLGGKDEIAVGSMGTYITAIDYKTGADRVAPQVQDRQQQPAGRVRAADDRRPAAVWRRCLRQLRSPSTGQRWNPQWHSAIGQVTNAPQTYMVDGRQYVLAAAGTRCSRSLCISSACGHTERRPVTPERGISAKNALRVGPQRN